MHATHEVTNNACLVSPRFRSPCLRSWSAAAHDSRPRWARWSLRSRASWRPRRRSATTPWRARATRTWGSVWRGLSPDTDTWSSYSRLWPGETQIKSSFWLMLFKYLTWLSFTNLNRKLPTHFFCRLDLEIILYVDHKLFERFMFFFPISKHQDTFRWIQSHWYFDNLIFFLSHNLRQKIKLENLFLGFSSKQYSSILSDCLSTPVLSKLDTWRKRVSLLDKEHAKSHKKMKAVVKKKSSAVEKLSKKAKKKAGDAELAEEHELKVNTWRRDSS